MSAGGEDVGSPIMFRDMDALGLTEVLVGVLALAASFGIYVLQRGRKSIAYSVLTDRSLLSVHSRFPVSVHHDERVVHEPRFVVVRLANNGNVAVQATDFERSVAFSFPGCEVLSAEVTGVRPDDLAPILKVGLDSITIEPCLLNPTDLIEVQCLIDGHHTEPRLEGRVVGVSSIERVRLPRDSWGRLWHYSTRDLIVAGAMSGLGIAVGVFSFFTAQGTARLGFGSVLLLAGIAFFLYSLSSFRKGRLWFSVPPPGEQ